ncbi:MAG: geranylgeranylglycerol-phosphate geranylgeranyltransferase [Flavisolibacter sp.]
MKLLAAFLRLIRWPNLVFIIITQVIFYTCVYMPLYGQLQNKKFIILVIASLFIAAAGYIINDYFDINIDRVNKPAKNVVDRVIHRRSAIIWHFVLSLLGVVLTGWAVGLSGWYIVLANLVSVFLLWFYSTSFKRKYVIGNVVISLLTSWTILVLFFAFTQPSDAYRSGDPVSVKFFRMAFLYAGFAFILSLIREAIKDMEDLEGDVKYNCRTLPVVSGVRATKLYVSVWIIVLMASLVVLQLYVLQFGWWILTIYSVLLIIAPLFLLLKKTNKATTPADFHYLSNMCKGIMLAGILSMIFFRFYF